MAQAQTGKSKQVTVRLSVEDWRAVRDAAYSQGLEMGPMVAQWIARRIDRLKSQRARDVATIVTNDAGRPAP